MDFTPAQSSPANDRPLRAMQLRHEITQFLEAAIADTGSIEGGGGMGSEDISLTINGERFQIIIPWKA